MMRRGSVGWMVLGGGLIFLAHPALAECTLSREWLRQEFKVAETNYPKAEALLRAIERQCPLSEPECPFYARAYYGTLKTLEAKYSFNPARKLISLNDGMRLLDQSVSAAPDDIEILFLRFATLHHLPAFLTDRQKRSQDLTRLCQMLLARDYAVVDKGTQLEMVDFLFESDRLSAGQEAALKPLRKELVHP